MAVSKRIRYEVLRRDNYTCRYCRSTENPLTVDHVTPVALGGTDDPSNLVAACRDCNAGKSSAAPDSSLVADVRDDALRHAELVKQAYEVLVEQMGLRDDYIDAFDQAFGYVPPSDYKETLSRWYRMGVPVEIITDAAEQTMNSRKSFTRDGRFRYFCGIVWNQVHAVTEAAFEKVTLDGHYLSDSRLTDERIEAYDIGHDKGYSSGFARAFKTAWLAPWNPVVAFVDQWPKDGSRIAENILGVELKEAWA